MPPIHTSHSGMPSDMAEESRRRQARMMVENKLRIEKQRVLEKQRLIQSIQRDVEHMNVLLHQKQGELARQQAEVSEERREIQQETQLIKKVDFEMRDLQNEMIRLQDEAKAAHMRLANSSERSGNKDGFWKKTSAQLPSS